MIISGSGKAGMLNEYFIRAPGCVSPDSSLSEGSWDNYPAPKAFGKGVELIENEQFLNCCRNLTLNFTFCHILSVNPSLLTSGEGSY